MKLKVICALVVAALLGWFLEVKQKPASSSIESGQKSSGKGEASVTSFSIGGFEYFHPALIDESNTDHRFTRFSDGVSYWHQTVKLSRELHRENQKVPRDLEIIDEILKGYRLIYQENPVGTDNEEFAAALAGENPKKVVFVDPGLLLNGELLDRFGSPYVFHPLKADVMGLRSRGPDGQLWTEDDVVFDEQDKAKLGLAREE